MNKKNLNMIILILFIISILFISYIELKDSLYQIKAEYIKKQTLKIITSKQETKYINELDFVDIKNISSLKLTDQNEPENNINHWKSIERKNSYNKELQFYSNDNVMIKGNIIEITSRKETIENKKYTSGLVESTSSYKYGYFEFNITTSSGKGIFPAIWLMPNNGDTLPEIDIFEMIGSEPYTFYGVIHFEENGIKDSDYFTYEVPIKNQYSVALEWKTDSLTWYIDNEKIYTTTQSVPQKYMYIIINQAIGGNWPGNPDNNTVFPNKFKIISTHIEPVFKKGRD